jgi:hypothetical protein
MFARRYQYLELLSVTCDSKFRESLGKCSMLVFCSGKCLVPPPPPAISFRRRGRMWCSLSFFRVNNLQSSSVFWQDRQCSYKRKIDARSPNHCCRGKTLSITHSECVSVFLPYLSSIQCACAVLYCHLWPVRLYHFFHIISQRTWFSGKSYWPRNVCFDFLYRFCLKHFSF